MKKGLAALFLGMVIILGACGNADDTNSDSAENLEAGEEVYRNNCANCHGADLSGNGGLNCLILDQNILGNKLRISSKKVSAACRRSHK